jgi:putative FmdB family regulatory protein
MPVFDFDCPKCGKAREDKFFRQSESTTLLCTKCGTQMKRRLPNSRINLDWEPFYDTVTETWIQSREHWRQNMKKHGLRPYEGTPDRCKGRWV